MAQVKFVRGNKITKESSWNSKVTADSIAFDKDNKEIYLGSDKYSQTKLTELTNDNAALQIGDSLNVAFSKLNNIIEDNEEVTAEALNDLNDRKVNTEDLATVAKTGSYNDLTDKPDTLVGPMIFKGSLGTGGIITTLPTASSNNTGYTYKVITNGTYASQTAKAGDTFISDGSTWILIPSGDEPSGTVTNVGMTVPTGLSISGSPITTSGTLAISYTNGYSIPTTAKQTSWDNKQDALTFDSTPTENSTNPVTSGGLYTVITKNEKTTAAALNDLNDRKVNTTALATVATSGSYNDLTNKPTIPTIPNLSKGTTTGSGNAVTDVTVNGHTITLTKGTTFANVASPTFTGIPKAPTAATGTNTTQIATTEFVQQELSNFDDEIFVPVSTLPTTNIKTNKIYIVPNSLAAPENNLYDEYIYKNNAWELIGTSQINLNSKQDTLVSGTNIKTINNESLLGSGNVNLYKSGTTTQRPTTNLIVGIQYFDTTLGQPIWWNGTAWVDALGNTPGSKNYVYLENN